MRVIEIGEETEHVKIDSLIDTKLGVEGTETADGALPSRVLLIHGQVVAKVEALEMEAIG